MEWGKLIIYSYISNSYACVERNRLLNRQEYEVRSDVALEIWAIFIFGWCLFSLGVICDCGAPLGKICPICHILFGTDILVEIKLSPIQSFDYQRLYCAYIVDVFFENDLIIHLLYHFLALKIKTHVSS